jgi:large subunit ribosomal protein L13
MVISKPKTKEKSVTKSKSAVTKTKKVAKEKPVKAVTPKGVGSIKDMNKTYYMRVEDRKPQWIVIDANGAILGRMATRIADILRGKHKATYTPHTDAGDYVIVINADKVVMSGDKMTDKVYAHYTGWMGGYKQATAKEIMQKDPTKLIELAVKGMMPKDSALSRDMMRKLLIYAGAEHPHIAQINAGKAAPRKK